MYISLKGKKSLMLIITLVFIAIAFFNYENNCLQVSYYKVVSNKVPNAFKDFKIIHISDLHSKNFGNHNHKLIKKIHSESPDIIVMTGDMINTKDSDYKVIIELSEQLSRKYNVYYVVGNHEQNLKENKKRELYNKLNEIGVKVLNNEKISVVKGNGRINIYGLWFNLKYYKDSNEEYTKEIFFGLEKINRILGSIDTQSFNILLTHNPLYFETYSKWGADLTLAGHIHGGMIRIPLKGGLLSPERELFPKYDAGKYQINDKILIVNRGLGNGDFAFRLFNRPEINVITLSNK